MENRELKNRELENREINALRKENNFSDFYIAPGIRTDYTRLQEYFQRLWQERGAYDFKFFAEAWRSLAFYTLADGRPDDETRREFYLEGIYNKLYCIFYFKKLYFLVIFSKKIF